MTTIAEDARRIGVLFNRIDDLDEVAYSFPEADDRCDRLRQLANATLAEEAPIRPTVAAALLGVDEQIVREWGISGVLIVATRRPRLAFDVTSVYEISRLIRDLRELDRDQLDEMWHQLTEASDRGTSTGATTGSAVIPRPRSAPDNWLGTEPAPQATESGSTRTG